LAASNISWVLRSTFRTDRTSIVRKRRGFIASLFFWIDRAPATNRQFKQFVRATATRPSPKFRSFRRTLLGAIIGIAIIACLWLSLEPQHLGSPSSILTTLASAETGALLASDF
jgi:hypothetical protein